MTEKTAQVYASSASKLSDEQAQGLAAIVERIADERGVCTPKALLEASRDEESPLHPLFEWDDKVAAEKHRLDHARRLIRCVRFITEGRDGPVEIPRFHHVKLRPQAGYVPFERVVNDRNLATEVLRTGMQRLAVWRQQYAALSSVLGDGVFKEIDAVLEKHAQGARPAP